MSKVRSRSSWIGGGSQRRAPANTTSSARHISRANPNFRANHRRRILRRFISIGLPALHHAMRTDHAAPERDWPFPGGGGLWIFAAVKARAAGEPRPRLGDMEDEIAALEVGGNHVRQQQRLVLGDRRPLQSVYLLLPGDQRVVGALLLGNREAADGADIRELPQVDLVETLGKIGDAVREISDGMAVIVIPDRTRREHELILGVAAGQRVVGVSRED